MPSEQNEEGTSHYRSGIFVQNVPAKGEKKSHRPPVIREEFRDLNDILARLSTNVEENTKAIKTLLEVVGKVKPDKKIPPKSQPTVVKVRVDFLRIIDIDTKQQIFHADVLVHATWVDPESKHRSDKPAWVPHLTIVNLEGDAEEERSWSGIKETPNNAHGYPVYYSCLRMKGKFRENLDLRPFPIDSQDLSLVVSCELPKKLLTLEEDRTNPSSVVRDAFEDREEFHLYHHVVVETGLYNQFDLDQTHLGHSILNFRCHVARRPGYYALNIMFILFCIVSLAFTCHVIPADLTKDRLSVALTVLLTVVAFKFKVNADLPTLPYLTYLGGFIFMNMFFVIIEAVGIASIGISATLYGLPYATVVDKYLSFTMIMVFLGCNVIYVSTLIAIFWRNRRRMSATDDEYLAQRKAYRNKDPHYNELAQQPGANRKSAKRKHKKRSVDPEEKEDRNGRGNFLKGKEEHRLVMEKSGEMGEIKEREEEVVRKKRGTSERGSHYRGAQNFTDA